MAQTKRTDLSVRQEQALLVGVLLPGSTVDANGRLAELASLARTAGARVVGQVVQRRERIDPAYYIGRGKAEELARQAAESQADVIIFDNDLSPGQIRELEELTDRKVIDRSELILDIFATRARTRQARLQVELAQLEYTAPRLRGMWTHLERIVGAGGATQAGVVGGVGTRGPGERQIEVDRRLVQRRVTALRRELQRIDRRKVREVRSRRGCFTVSIVGYTNAGKSCLMNALTDAGVTVEDKLFATLDTRTRQWRLGDGLVALLSDTVGFVRDLPHHLIASFRATLEEAINADLLLHVADVSSPMVDQQIAAVEQVLAELNCSEKPTLLLLNKMDIVEDRSLLQVVQARRPEAIPISARTGSGLDRLTEEVASRLRQRHVRAGIEANCTEADALAFIERTAQLLDRQVQGQRVHMTVAMHPADLARLAQIAPDVQITRHSLVE